MKPISEMSLRESISRLWQGLHELRNSDLEPRLSDIVEELDGVDDRIFELTRWIPVSERLPTKKDGDRNGMVLWWTEMEVAGPVMNYWDVHHIFPLHVTHWRRNDPPEDV